MSFLKGLLSVKADMNMQVDEKAWLGLPMKGVITLQAHDTFRVENIVLQIRVYERYMHWVKRKDQHGHVVEYNAQRTDTLYYQDLPITKSFETATGSKMELPFEINIPVQTARAPGGTIDFSLKAVANIKGRPDLAFEISRTLEEVTKAKQ